MKRHKNTVNSVFWLITAVLLLFQAGCKTPAQHRQQMDKAAQDILTQKTQQALGREGTIDIERPSDILRRRLLEEQGLIISGPESLGTDKLDKIEHWPKDPNMPMPPSADAFVQIPPGQPLRLTLVDALQIGARNSSDYQTQKEDVFQQALALYLEQDDFRTLFSGQVSSLISTDTTGDRTQTGTVQSGNLSASRKFYNGAEIQTNIAADLANLLTGGGASSLGLVADTSVSIPLMRGAGRHIVTEPLTQAERNVVYALWDFEQYKKAFSVQIATDYLAVLRRLDEVRNSRENYRSVIASAQRSRRLADAGRIQEIEVDQATQNELRARQGWIAAQESYQNGLNAFKAAIGLPPDAAIELDPNELVQLVAPTDAIRTRLLEEYNEKAQHPTPPADALIVLAEPTGENAGPWELNENNATQIALDNRLDFRIFREQVYDAQRKVVVAADQLRAELTLGGVAAFGDGRSSVGSAALDDAQLRLDKGTFAGLLTVDLPLNRTAEAVNYRNSLITLERSVRQVQKEEDRIKLSVSNTLSVMRQTRENLYIQTQAVMVAEKRVRSVSLFLEAGRAQMRDLLEAQDDLLAAQNGLTTAAVGYRVAELELQQNLGLLAVDERGLWQESLPENLTDVEN